jgi:hypothetical protein
LSRRCNRRGAAGAPGPDTGAASPCGHRDCHRDDPARGGRRPPHAAGAADAVVGAVRVSGGVIVADFASGLLHWGADTWGRADLPVIGRRLLVPFRVHHLNPNDFLRRRFLDTNGDVATLTIPALLGLLVIPLDTAWQQSLATAGLTFCAFGGMTNQIHQWAHSPSPPTVVRALQSSGVLLRPAQHASHHEGLYDTGYCITTGWCNRPLEAIRFFRQLEHVITRLSGVVPRADEQTLATRDQPGHRPVAHDV